MSLRSEVIRIFNELMAGSKKITELPAGTSPAGSELIEGVQGGQNVKFTVSQLGGGEMNWRGAYDLAAESPDYPSSGGTGAAGVPAAGNQWYVSTSGDLDVTGLGVITLNVGAILIYLGGTVSSPASWKVIQ